MAFGQLHRGIGERHSDYNGISNQRKIRSMKNFEDGIIKSYDIDFKIQELNRRNLQASESDSGEEVNQEESLLDVEYY